MPNRHPIDVLLRGGIAIYVAVLVLALYPYVPDPAFDIKLFITHWAAAILPMPLLGAALFLGRPLRKPVLLFWPFLLLVILNAVSCYLSPFVGHSLNKVTYLFSLFSLYLVATQVYTAPSHVRSLMYVLCSAVALSSVYALFQKMGLDPFPWDERMLTLDEYTNLPGTFGNPNVAGHTLVLAIVAAGYLISKKKGRWCIVLGALFITHLLFTHHRAGLLATSLTLVVLTAVALKRVWTPWSISLRATAVLAIVMAGVGGLYWMTGSRDSGEAGASPLDGSTLLRYNSNYGAAQMIAERPLTGYGPDNYKLLNPQFWTEYEQEFFAIKRVMNYHVHNEVLQIAVDAGLPAAAAYLCLLISGICAGWSLRRNLTEPVYRRLGLFYALFFLAFLVDSLFGFNFHSPVSGVILALFAGTLEGIRKIAPQSEPLKSSPIVAASFASAAFILVIASSVLATHAFASRVLLQRAKGALLWEYHDQADVILARAEQYAPHNWEIPFHRGIISGEKGNHEGALDYFESSLERNPTYIRVLFALAQTAFNMATTVSGPENSELLNRSEEYARRIQEICPMLPDSETLLGYIALYRASQLKDSTPDQAARIDSDLAVAHQYLTNALQHGAEGSGHLYNALARTYQLQGDLGAAFDTYGKGVAHSPRRMDIWLAYYTLSRTLDKESIYRENLIKGYEKLLDDEADVPNALAAVANAWLETPAGTTQAAARLGATIRALNDTTPSPIQKAELSWAIPHVLSAFSAAPPSGDDAGAAYLSMGVTLSRVGDPVQAEEMLSKAVPLLSGPEQFFAMGCHADVLLKLDKGDEAEAMLRTAVFANRSKSELRLIYARFLAKRGKVAQALFEFSDILQKFSFDENFRRDLVEEMNQLQELL